MTMTTDRYTKAILTVIAGCLLWQCLMMSARPVAAQQQQQSRSNLAPGVLADRVQPVVIVGWGEMNTQGHVAVSLKRLPNGSLITNPDVPVKLHYTSDNPMPVSSSQPVRLSYTPDNPLPVGVTLIKRTTDYWDAIATQVMRQPPTRMPGNE
jgi:hypothetical protein